MFLPWLFRLAAATVNDAAGSKITRSAGAPADLVIFDPAAPFTVAAASLKSQGKNTPFLGYELAGRVRCTIVDGKVVYES